MSPLEDLDEETVTLLAKEEKIKMLEAKVFQLLDLLSRERVKLALREDQLQQRDFTP